MSDSDNAARPSGELRLRAGQTDSNVKPYVGLRPYSERDAAFFFGREHERDTLINNLIASRLTILYGATGVGKSSVLRAGVAPYFRQLARASFSRNKALGSQEYLHDLQEPEYVLIVFDRWSNDPIIGLAQRIHEALNQHKGVTQQFNPPTSRSLADIIQSYTLQLNGKLLIILDQFEEYFVYHPQEDGEGSFAQEFPNCVNRYDLRANFLISIRDDALAKLDCFKGRVNRLFDNMVRIGHLDRDSANAAIRRPLAEYNALHSASGGQINIDADLVEELLNNTEVRWAKLAQAGPGVPEKRDDYDLSTNQIDAPLLQLVLSRLWDEEVLKGSRTLSLQTLKDLGGVDKIASTHVDEAMERLQKPERDIAADLFQFLITPSFTKLAQECSTLAKWSGLKDEQVQPVLDKLSSSEVNLLRRVSVINHPAKYEIPHDVLASAIIDWRARYTEVREKAEFERKAQQREKRDKRQAIIATIIAGVAVATVIFVEGLRQQARHAQQEAEIQSKEAQRLKNEAEVQGAKVQKVLDIVRKVSYFKAIMLGHEDTVSSIAFNHDGSRVLTASKDATAIVWNAETGEIVSDLRGHTQPVTSAAFSPDGTKVVTASFDKTARVWNADTGQSIIELREHTGPVNSVVFNTDGTQVVTASGDGTARIWNLRPRDTLNSVELRGHSGMVRSADFSPDGSLVVTASVDGTARVWETSEGRPVAELAGHRGVVNMASFDPYGKLVVTAGADATARVWDANTGQKVAEFTGHQSAVYSAKFSPSGRLIVTASEDRTARVWDVASERPVAEMKGHSGAVVSAEFSRDEQRVITASTDETAVVWEANSGRKLAELRGHVSRVNKAVFSPDGNSVATASADTTARTWDIKGLGNFRVSEVSLTASPEDFSGPCPATINLVGSITVIGGKGTVRYRFVRTDRKNDVGPERTLIFDEPGKKEVSTAWRFGGPTFPNVSGSFYLQVTYPQESISGEVSFKVKCGLSQPEGMFVEKLNPTITGLTEVEFRWQPVPTAVSYRVEIQHETVNSNILKVTPVSRTGPVSVRLSLAAGSTQWRVWAINQQGVEGPKSEWQSISVK